MKKTKILLVLAIAMLAMFAMSACTLIASGIEKVEFEVMPKNYFKVNGFAGINVAFDATIGGNVYTVNYTADANVNNEPVAIMSGDTKVMDVNVTVTGYPTELKMGEYTIEVKVEGFKTEYAFRLCEVLTSENFETTLETEGEMGYYMIETSFDVDMINVARSFVLYGNGNTLTKTDAEGKSTSATGANSSAKMFIIDGSLVNDWDFDVWGKAPVAGHFEFNNVVMDASNYVSCVTYRNLKGATINFNACTLASKNYAINSGYCDDITVNISNGTTATAWNALTIRTNNSVYNIDSVTFNGINKNDSKYSYGTIVLDGGAGADKASVKEMAYNNVLNISNTNLYASQEEGYPAQKLVSVQYHAAKNIINLVDCKNAVTNEVLTAPINGLFSMHDNVSVVYNKDGSVYCNMTVLTGELINKLYINGTLFTAENL